MNLELCKLCGGKGTIRKTVFPNSHYDTPCVACEERFQALKKKAEDLGLIHKPEETLVTEAHKKLVLYAMPWKMFREQRGAE